MSLELEHSRDFDIDPLDIVEVVLEAANWPFERDEEGTIQVVAETRWGDMGALFAYRPEPSAIHFSLTLDVKAMAAKRSAQVATGTSKGVALLRIMRRTRSKCRAKTARPQTCHS